MSRRHCSASPADISSVLSKVTRGQLTRVRYLVLSRIVECQHAVIVAVFCLDGGADGVACGAKLSQLAHRVPVPRIHVVTHCHHLPSA